MLFWIILCLIVYVVGLFLPPLFLVGRIGVSGYLGSRDDEPVPSDMHGRANRASRNFTESLAPFLGLAILAMVVDGADMDSAMFGAQIFVIARIVYIPLYLLGVPVIRSGAWIAGFVGLILMAAALV